LIERDGIEPKMAEFASSAAQGHIGRARYLATSEEARETRKKILNIPSTALDLPSALEAANTLLEMAKEQVKKESDTRDEEEISKLKESYGTTGSRLATGGSKAVKELEKEQKNRIKRSIKDYVYLNIVDFYYSYSIFQDKVNPQKNIANQSNKHLLENQNHITEILSEFKKTLESLESNNSINLVLENLFIKFIRFNHLKSLDRKLSL
jgi:DNA polymerase-3 subunit delta'